MSVSDLRGEWGRSGLYLERRRYDDDLTAITDRNHAWHLYDGAELIASGRANSPAHARKKADEAARARLGLEAKA